MAGMSLKKIVLKNKTSLSLNERFTYLRRQNEQRVSAEVMVQPNVGRGDMMRQQRANMQRASAKNRRLALQMENRPAVAAALRIKKRNMRQRVGLAAASPQVNVKERLTLSPRARLGWRGRGGLARGGQQRGGNMQRGLQLRGRGQGLMRRGQGQMMQRIGGGAVIALNTMRSAGNFRPQRGQSRNRGGIQRGGYFNPRGRNMQQQGGFGGFNRRGRGNFSPRMRGGQGQQQRRGQRRGQGQQRGGRGGQRGRQQQRAAVPTKDELDSQLDEYMSSTKSVLDKELDQYMSVA